MNIVAVGRARSAAHTNLVLDCFTLSELEFITTGPINRFGGTDIVRSGTRIARKRP
jgi:hypothetical protein